MNSRELLKNILKNCDAICVENLDKDPISDGISWFENGSITHVACYIGDLNVIEAEPVGVIQSSLKKYCDGHHNLTIRRVSHYLSPEEQKSVVNYWNSHLGSKYDFGQIVGLGVLEIVRKLGWRWALKKIPNVFGDPNKYTCGELWLRGVRLVTPDLLSDYNIENIAPETILKDSRLVTVTDFSRPTW